MDVAPAELALAIAREARKRGFARVGFTPVEPLARGPLLAAWLSEGRHGEMSYMALDPGARADPRSLLEAARTLITVVASYHHDEAPSPPGTGFVARYARGTDYHLVLRRHLRELAAEIRTLLGRAIAWRACVDTAPLLEREAAARAGVGFVAKNTLLITPGLGSYTVLGELLVDAEIGSSQAEEPRCGECRRCLTACPTGAITGEWSLDARRCVSYLTIELRGPIPRELRRPVGTMIFGCDRCQEVCPFNEHSPRETMPDLIPLARLAAPRLVDLLAIGSAQYRKLVERTALRRVRRAQLLRNVAVALGNAGDATAVPALASSLLQEREPLVRGHVAWALGELGGARSLAALREAERRETDAFVIDEVRAALVRLTQGGGGSTPLGA